MIPWWHLHPIVPIPDTKDREEVKEWIQKASDELDRLQQRNEQLENIFSHIFPVMTGDVFITGVSDETDEQGFPDKMHVCIAYGADVLKIYRRIDDHVDKDSKD